MIEPTSDASVSPLDRWRARKLTSASSSCATPWTCNQHARHEEPGQDRETRDRREREDDPAQVGPHGVAFPGQRGQASAERTRLTVENREGRRRRTPGSRRGGSVGDDDALGGHGWRTGVSPLPELETSPHLGRRTSASRGAHDAFPRRPLRSARDRRRDLHRSSVVRALPGHAGAAGEGGRARRRRGGASASRPARLPRPPARPLCHDRAAADAGVCDHIARDASARCARGARAPRRGDPARRQLRRGVGLRPPRSDVDERAPRRYQPRQHPHRRRARPRARDRRAVPTPEPLVAALPDHGARGHGDLDARRQGSGRTPSTDAEPGCRIARPVVPERSLRYRSCVLRRGGARDRTWASRPRTST